MKATCVRAASGFSLVELMVTIVIMSVLAVGVAQFSAMAFATHASNARQAETSGQTKGALAFLERDVALAGLGLPVGTAAFGHLNNAGENGSDVLTLSGLPLAGPHQAPWSYVIEGGTGTTFWVRCFGKQQGASVVPDPLVDLTGSALVMTPVRALSYSGQDLGSSNLAIVANEAQCSTPDIDYDGDGQRDLAQRITLNAATSLPAGALIVAMRSFDGVTAPTVTYRLTNRALTRTVAGRPAEPLLFGVEDFQVLYAVAIQTNPNAVTAGTGLPVWRSSPPWNANERVIALRVGMVLSNPSVQSGREATLVTLFDHSYALPATMQTWERHQALFTFAARNALLAHP